MTDNSFYKTQAWRKTAIAYAKSKQNLCELCLLEGRLTPGEIVHHKIPLNETNVNDPDISLSWDNLCLVCREHHAELHGKKKRYKIDNFGHVIPLDMPPALNVE